MTREKRLLLLGGSVFCIRYIQAAREMGLKVVACDRNPAAPALAHADWGEAVDISDPQACLALARRHRVAGVVAINDFGVMSAAVCARELGLPGPSLETVEIALDKLRMRQVWEAAGVPSVRYLRVGSPGELAAAMAELGGRLIIKPCNSRGGGCRGIRQVTQDDDPVAVYDFANSFYQDDNLIVEEFVEGLEHSVEVLVHQGRSHILAISDKVKSPLPYRVDDTILYPTVETGSRLRELEDAVRRAVEAVGLEEGIAHVELSVTERGPVLFEIGIRCGGGAPDPLVPHLTGVNEFQEAVRLALGQAPLHTDPLYTKGAVIRFFYPPPGVVESVEGMEQASRLPGVLSLHLFVAPGQVVRPLRTCGDRAGIVIAGGEDREQALARANQVLKTVRIRTRPLQEAAA